MISTLLRELALGGLAPTLVEQASETVTYIGFCRPGTNADSEDRWCIKKIEQVGTLTVATYAEGSTNFNLKWSERVRYTYKFRN